jgi:hypothetical protein
MISATNARAAQAWMKGMATVGGTHDSAGLTLMLMVINPIYQSIDGGCESEGCRGQQLRY